MAAKHFSHKVLIYFSDIMERFVPSVQPCVHSASNIIEVKNGSRECLPSTSGPGKLEVFQIKSIWWLFEHNVYFKDRLLSLSFGLYGQRCITCIDLRRMHRLLEEDLHFVLFIVVNILSRQVGAFSTQHLKHSGWIHSAHLNQHGRFDPSFMNTNFPLDVRLNFCLHFSTDDVRSDFRPKTSTSYSKLYKFSWRVIPGHLVHSVGLRSTVCVDFHKI